MLSNTDNIHSLSHYKLDELDIKSIDVIKMFLGKEKFKAYCYGKILEYLFKGNSR